MQRLGKSVDWSTVGTERTTWGQERNNNDANVELVSTMRKTFSDDK
jgi:hypothetical protein